MRFKLHIVLMVLVASGMFGLAACNADRPKSELELPFPQDTIVPAAVTSEQLPDSAVCEGLDRYVEANIAYLESLRNYDNFDDATRDSLYTATLQADEFLETNKETLSLECLDRYRVHSVEFTREMRAILMADPV